MTEFMVSVEIVTREADVAEISRVLGIPGSPSSHNRGDRRGFKGDVWDGAVWKIESGLEGKRSVSDHVSGLLPRVIPALIRERAQLPKDCSVYLNVGAIFHTLTCSVSLSPEHLRQLSEAGISLEVTCYPASSEPQAPGT
jgi:hypothetical protein